MPRPEKPESIADFLKEQVALIGLLIILVGLLSTDAYYATFGLQYQFMDLPVSHLLYRGLTVIFDAPSLLLPYVLIVLFFVADAYFTKHPRLLKHRGWLTYLLITIILLISGLLAYRAGKLQAQLDLREDTCRLPYVVSIETSENESIKALKNSTPAARVLQVGANYTILFVPRSPDESEDTNRPHIFRIANGDIHALTTNR